MKKIFYIALTIVLGLAGTSCDREKLTYDSEPGEISGKTGTLDLSSFDAIPNNDIKETEKKWISIFLSFTLTINPILRQFNVKCQI